MGASGHVKAKPLAEKTIVVRAIADSFAKLNPRTMMKNPVMFVVEVGAVLTTVDLECRLRYGCGSRSFLQISRKPWPKAAGKRKQKPCARRARKRRRTDCAQMAR